MAVTGIQYLCRLKGLGKAANNFVVGANIEHCSEISKQISDNILIFAFINTVQNG